MTEFLDNVIERAVHDPDWVPVAVVAVHRLEVIYGVGNDRD